MLHYEDQIEDNRDIGQDKFGRVAGNPTPVFVEAGIDEQLEEGEYAADKVEEDHFDFPVFGGFAFEVEPGLGDVFDNSEEDFYVGDEVYLIWYFPRVSHALGCVLASLTHHINPCPSVRVVPSVRTRGQNNTGNDPNQSHTAPENSLYGYTGFLVTRNREPPYQRPKLCVGQDAEDEGMHSKGHIIEPHCWLLRQ